MDDYDDYYDEEYNNGDGSGSQAEEQNVEDEFYNAKGMEDDGDVDDALNAFNAVVTLEAKDEKGPWGFKALKHIVRIHYKKKEFDDMMERYREMLTYIKKAVTTNDADRGINSLLEFVAKDEENIDVLLDFYAETTAAAKSVNSDRLWFKTNLRLARLWERKGEMGKLKELIDELHESCKTPEGIDDIKKANSLVEVYVLQIQYFDGTGDFESMRAAYSKAVNVKNVTLSYANKGVIQETGGKVNAKSGAWSQSYEMFYGAFRAYDEGGQARRLLCLKYLVIANMMMMSRINPFESPETRPYKDVAEVLPLVNLVAAYQRSDIEDFSRLLEQHKASIVDSFIEPFVPDLFHNIRTQLLLRMITPYTSVRVPFIAKSLNISEAEVEAMLVSLVLDERVDGQMDQIKSVLMLSSHAALAARYHSLASWTSRLERFNRIITSKVSA